MVQGSIHTKSLVSTMLSVGKQHVALALGLKAPREEEKK